jgi:hypothetical protein
MFAKNKVSTSKTYLVLFVLAVGLIYYFSNPKPQNYYDYTFRVAENILRGAIGFSEKPPSWLNEFVPFEGKWHSVFPLGSVITMMPFALLKVIGLIKTMPAAFIAALSAGLVSLFSLLIAEKYELPCAKRVLIVSGILFGTWMWTNLTMAGAWQLALGWAMVGELGAIYFTVFNRRPLLAGAFFALAFGNRTEILLTAPVFMYLWISDFKSWNSEDKRTDNLEYQIEAQKAKLASLALFCAFPFVLGVLTLIYNFIRFHSFTDFGYSRIPGVLHEPWYRYGIFSIWYIPQNFREMLYTPWKYISTYPYLVPTGFGGAIWWSSPFIFFLFRRGAKNKILKRFSWLAIAVLTFLLWIHGNPGGWQFAYRYAMILLPWMFLILLENSPKKITPVEWIAYAFSFIVNVYATYLFFWTDYVKP